MRFYFKNLYVQNDGRVKKNVPVIYVANHQNAFIDAIIIAVTSKTQPASLVRADVFKTPLARKILSSIKMMPVYRMRDGYRTPAKNEETFQKARDYLAKNGSLIIFPEGNHGGLKKLRPLKHGAARVAAKTVCYSVNSELIIQPVGLEYSNHSKFRANAAVIFGKPITVNKRLFHKGHDDPQALRSITRKIEIELKSIIYHQNAERKNKLIFDFINTLYPENVQDEELFTTNFTAAKAAAMKFNYNPLSDDRISQMQEALEHAKAAGFPGAHYDSLRDYRKPLWMSVLLFLPVLPAVAAYFLPYWFLKLLQYKIKDVQFRTSIKFTLGIIVFPVWNILLFLLVAVFTGSWVPALITMIFCTISGRFFLHFRDSLAELRRTQIFYRRGNRAKYAELLEKMQSLVPR